MNDIKNPNDLKGYVKAAGGIREVSVACEVTYEAVRKWVAAGRLPRTDWTGETNYADLICNLALARHQDGNYIAADLLDSLKQSAA